MTSIFKTFGYIHIVLGIILLIPAIQYFTVMPVFLGLCLFYIGIGIRLSKQGINVKSHIIKIQKLLFSIGLLIGFYGMFSINVSSQSAAISSRNGELILGLALLMIVTAGLTLYYVGYVSSFDSKK